MKPQLPKALKQGDVVGIIAPAGYVNESQIEKAAKKIENLGFRPLVDKNIFQKYGYLAGKDTFRAMQINDMFKNKDVKAIIAARGGYGTSRILDMLDYDLIQQNPKIIGGYSDITALICAIYKKTSLVTFHSSMLIPEDTEYTRETMIEIFKNGKKGFIIKPEEKDSKEITIFNSGKAKGILFGGNLTLIETLIGTQYDFSLYNKILFLEEINEPPYKIDRMLTHLKNSKNLSNLKGIVFGKFQGCQAQGNNSLQLEEVIQDFCKDLKCPIIMNFSFGHVTNRCTLPIGIKAELNTKTLSLKLLEDCVES